MSLLLLDLEVDFGSSFFSMSLTSMLGRREINNQLLLCLRPSRVRFKNVMRNGCPVTFIILLVADLLSKSARVTNKRPGMRLLAFIV